MWLPQSLKKTRRVTISLTENIQTNQIHEFPYTNKVHRCQKKLSLFNIVKGHLKMSQIDHFKFPPVFEDFSKSPSFQRGSGTAPVNSVIFVSYLRFPGHECHLFFYEDYWGILLKYSLSPRWNSVNLFLPAAPNSINGTIEFGWIRVLFRIMWFHYIKRRI